MIPIRDAIVIFTMNIIVAVIIVVAINKDSKCNNPYFVVTEMVQCKAHICNAVLDMDDIAILIPFDSTKVHVGDKIYLVK